MSFPKSPSFFPEYIEERLKIITNIFVDIAKKKNPTAKTR